MSITKKDIVTHIAKARGLKDNLVKEVVEQLFTEIIANLRNGEKIELRNFGVFEVKNRKPKIGRNPKTKEEVRIPARRVVTFKVGKVMREEVEPLISEMAEAAPRAEALQQGAVAAGEPVAPVSPAIQQPEQQPERMPDWQ